MKLTEAQKLALSFMGEHGLIEKGWTFQFDKSVRRFGCCFKSLKRITLSEALVKLNEESIVKNTILHEIAHALVGVENGHNWVWKQKAIQIGCSGNRCYDSERVITPPKKYRVTCKNCKIEFYKNRKSKDSACIACCQKYNFGRWSKDYLVTYRINK